MNFPNKQEALQIGQRKLSDQISLELNRPLFFSFQRKNLLHHSHHKQRSGMEMATCIWLLRVLNVTVWSHFTTGFRKHDHARAQGRAVDGVDTLLVVPLKHDVMFKKIASWPKSVLEIILSLTRATEPLSMMEKSLIFAAHNTYTIDYCVQYFTKSGCDLDFGSPLTIIASQVATHVVTIRVRQVLIALFWRLMSKSSL